MEYLVCIIIGALIGRRFFPDLFDSWGFLGFIPKVIFDCILGLGGIVVYFLILFFKMAIGSIFGD